MNLTDKIYCIITINRAEIWINKNQREITKKAMENDLRVIEVDGNLINPQNCEIYTLEEMVKITNRKNGRWQCKVSKWHERGEKCDCIKNKISELIEKRNEIKDNCKYHYQHEAGCKCEKVIEDINKKIKQLKEL
jgi:hypothetical protein